MEFLWLKYNLPVDYCGIAQKQQRDGIIFHELPPHLQRNVIMFDISQLATIICSYCAKTESWKTAYSGDIA